MSQSKSSIFQRENGYWYYRRQVNGRYIRPSLGTKSKREARRLQKKKDTEYEVFESKGLVIDQGFQIPSLKDAIDTYTLHKKVNYRYATYNNDRKRLGLVLDFIGNIRLDKVTESLINEFIAYRQDMVTYTTYRGDLVVLKAMINYFYKRDVLEKNPFKHIPIRQISTNPVYLNEKDVEKLLNLEYDKRSWMRNFFRVALLTGFRRGELATLRWDNIDYEKGEITVYGKTGQRFFPIKGYDELKSTLDDIPKESPYVFHKTRKKDKGFHEDKLSTYTREVFNKLDFDPKYTLHSLRHTVGAHQYMGGTPLEKIQLMMGHKNIYVTQMYAHVDITGEDVSNGLTYSSLISQPFKKD